MSSLLFHPISRKRVFNWEHGGNNYDRGLEVSAVTVKKLSA